MWGTRLAVDPAMWGTRSSGGDVAGEKAFAGEAGEDGEAERVELVEVGEQGVILVEDLAEAEAGVEHDGLAGDAGSEGGAGAGFEVAEDEEEDVGGGERRRGGPLVRATAGVYHLGLSADLPI